MENRIITTEIQWHCGIKTLHDLCMDFGFWICIFRIRLSYLN